MLAFFAVFILFTLCRFGAHFFVPHFFLPEALDFLRGIFRLPVGFSCTLTRDHKLGEIMPFDPSSLSVKAASKKLDGLSLDELKSLHEKELDGKHRSSLMAAISRQMDLLIEEDEKPEVVEEAPVAAAPAPEPAPPAAPVDKTISMTEWFRLNNFQKRSYTAIGGGRMKHIG